MYRRTFSILLFAALLAMLGTTLFAQVTTVPDEGVRGSGSIITRGGNVANFDINVARSGSIISGGFKYSELTGTSIRGHVIYSQKITGLRIEGNFATISAVGYWNGMLANITVEALDDLSGDWFHISAVPQGPLLIIYDEKGGVKGDILVYRNVQVPDAVVKGEGMIAVGRNAGRFSIVAEKSGNAVKGSIYYVEYNPYAMSIVERPVVKIYVPAVTKFIVDGMDAILAGQGTLNGKPAMIEVRAKDGQMYPTLIYMPDEFYIKAISLQNDSLSRVGYQAGGQLKTGDITIKVSNSVY